MNRRAVLQTAAALVLPKFLDDDAAGPPAKLSTEKFKEMWKLEESQFIKDGFTHAATFFGCSTHDLMMIRVTQRDSRELEQYRYRKNDVSGTPEYFLYSVHTSVFLSNIKRRMKNSNKKESETNDINVPTSNT